MWYIRYREPQLVRTSGVERPRPSKDSMTLGSQRSGVVGQLATSKQTRHVTRATQPGSTGEISGRTEQGMHCGVVKYSRTVIAGRVRHTRASNEVGRTESGPGRAFYRGAKATSVAETWSGEATDPSGVCSNGTRGRLYEGRMRSPEVGGALGRRRRGIRAETRKPSRRRSGKSEEVIVAMKVGKPTGAKGLCLSHADAGGGTA